MTDELTQDQTDSLAWKIAVERDRWVPYQEEVQNCINTLEDPNARKKAYEEGYHAGALSMLDDLENWCRIRLDWDLREAAQRSVDNKPELDLEDVQDYEDGWE